MRDALCDIITLDQPLYFNIFFIIKIPYYDIHGICTAPTHLYRQSHTGIRF